MATALKPQQVADISKNDPDPLVAESANLQADVDVQPDSKREQVDETPDVDAQSSRRSDSNAVDAAAQIHRSDAVPPSGIVDGTVILRGHSDRVVDAAFSSSGDMIVSSGVDKTIRCWDLSTNSEIWKTQVSYAFHRGCAWSPDASQVALAGDRDIIILNANSGKLSTVLKGHARRSTTVAFASDGKHVASGGEDGTVRIWTLDGKLVRTVQAYGGERVDVRHVSFSPGSQRIAAMVAYTERVGPNTTRRETVLRIWDVSSGTQTHSIGEASGECVVFSSDGRRLLAGGAYVRNVGPPVAIWDVENGEKLMQMDGHATQICGVSFAQDDSFVVSYGRASFGRKEGNRLDFSNVTSSGEFRIWDTRGRLIKTLRGFGESPSFKPSFSADGARVAFRAENTVRVLTLLGRTAIRVEDATSTIEESVATDPKPVSETQIPGCDGSVPMEVNARLWKGKSEYGPIRGGIALDKDRVCVAYKPGNQLSLAVVDRDGNIAASTNFSVPQSGAPKHFRGPTADGGILFSVEGAWDNEQNAPDRNGYNALYTWKPGEEAKLVSELKSAAFDADILQDGSLIAVTCAHGEILTFSQANDGQYLLKETLDEAVEVVAFTEDGVLSTLRSNQQLAHWNLEAPNLTDVRVCSQYFARSCWKVGTQRSNGINFGPRLRQLDIASNEWLPTVELKGDGYNRLVASESGNVVVASNLDGLVFIWPDATEDRCVYVNAGKNQPPIFVSPDGRRVHCVVSGNQLASWSVTELTSALRDQPNAGARIRRVK